MLFLIFPLENVDTGPFLVNKTIPEPQQKKSDRWTDLPTRIISALVILPVSLGCIWAGGDIFLIFLTALSLFCSYEWCRISGLGSSIRLTILFWFCILLSFAVLKEYNSYLSYIVPVVATIIMYAVSHKKGRGNASLAAFGIPYLLLAFITCYYLRDSDQGVWNLAWLVAMVVATDIGAYMSGRTFGGPKIAPKISPKKTWAGLIGAIVASLCVTELFIRYDFAFDTALLSYLTAVLIPVVAQAGDFLESWMKRRASIKDSSSLIPGHGGFLDRLDGFLAALPIFTLLKSFL